jgi:hypothetical protein
MRPGHAPSSGRNSSPTGRRNAPPADTDEWLSYTEYTLRDTTVAMIEDLTNECAWIQSNVIYPVEV